MSTKKVPHNSISHPQPDWQWYDYVMPDGVHDRFRAPDEATADEWASRHWNENMAKERQRQQRLQVIRNRLQQIHRAYIDKIQRLYDQNCATGTFADLDGSFGQNHEQIQSSAPPPTIEVRRQKTSRKKQKESFLDVLGL